jgi:hypothetical protein
MVPSPQRAGGEASLADVIIENPILNSAYEVLTRYLGFTEKEIANEPVEGRWRSGYFIPIPPPKKKGTQLSFETEWMQVRFEESRFINDVRERVNLWRKNRQCRRKGATKRKKSILHFAKRVISGRACFLTFIRDACMWPRRSWTCCTARCSVS